MKEIRPSDLVDVIESCVAVQNTYYRVGSGFTFSEEIRTKAAIAVRETYDLYLKQIAEQRVRGDRNADG